MVARNTDTFSNAQVGQTVLPCRAVVTNVVDKKEEIVGDVKNCCIVNFYRSEENVKGEYSSKDPYNGAFGFDNYDSVVCAAGDIQYYKILEGVIPNNNTVSGISDKKKYLCPYLSIRTGQKVTIYFKVEKANNYDKLKNELENKGNKDALKQFIISFESTNPNLSLTPAKNVKCSLSDDKSSMKLEIECTGNIEEETSVKAILSKIDGKDTIETLVGEFIVIPNKMNYNAIVQPIYIYPKEETGYPENLKPDLKILQEILNEHIFNQALIEMSVNPPENIAIQTKKEGGIDAAISKYVTGDKIDYTHRESFNSFMEGVYMSKVSDNSAKGQGDISDDENKSALRLRETKLISKTKDYLKKLKKELNYNNKDSLIETLKYFNKHSVSLASAKASDPKKAFDAAENDYTSNESVKRVTAVVSNQEKRFHIQVYIYSFIQGAPNTSKANAAAYSGTGSGKCHIFIECLKPNGNIDKDLTARLIAHEIGHALGLKHTFKDDNYNPDPFEYRDSDKISKKDLENELGEVKKRINIIIDTLKKLLDISKREQDGIKKLEQERANRAQKAGVSAVAIQITDDDYQKLEKLDTQIKTNIIEKIEYQIKTVERYEQKQPSPKTVMGMLKDVETIENEINSISKLEAKYPLDTIYDWKRSDTGLATIDIGNDSDSTGTSREKLEAEQKEKQKEADRLKDEIDNYNDNVEVKKLSVVFEQSKTKDNLMDYDHDKDGNKDDNFQYKTLRKWQWDILISATVYSKFVRHEVA